MKIYEDKTPPPLDAWPIPSQVPRRVRSLGTWPESTRVGVGLVLAALISLAALVWAIYVAIDVGKLSGMICPLLLVPLNIAGFAVIAAERRKRRRMLKEGLVCTGHATSTAHPHTTRAKHKTLYYTYRYRPSDDLQRRFAIVPPTANPSINTLEVGSPLSVLIHPEHASTHVVPGLFGIEFEAVEDRRPANIVSATPSAGGLSRQSTFKVEGGQVEVGPEGLRVRHEHFAEASIEWASPFVVQMTAWLLSDESLKLGVTVRQRGAMEATPVRFVVALPQCCVSQEVPIQQHAGAVRLSRAGFETIWRALRWYGSLNGQVPQGVDLELSPKEAPKRPREAGRAHNGPLLIAAAVQVCLAAVIWFALDYNDPIRAGERGCNAGEGEACLELGEFYESERFAPHKAFRLYEQSCDLGHAEGCVTAGDRLDENADDPDRALEFYRRACADEHPGGCFQVGWLIQKKERNTDQENTQAAAAYQVACDGKSWAGCHNLAVMMNKGKGVEKDDKEAARLYKRSCNKEFWSACTNLGWSFEHGRGVEKDTTRAAKLYRIGCDENNTQGCTNLGWLYDQGIGVAQDYVQARHFATLACNKRNGNACNNLGLMFQKGKGVEKDLAAAVELYKKSCKEGYARGCSNEAWMIQRGQGVLEKDEARALKLFEKACEEDIFSACTSLGWTYEKALGVERDDAKAAGFYKRACDAKNRTACNNYGVMLVSGRGVEKNPSAAVPLYTFACDEGDKLACSNLGLLYRDGKGVDQNDGLAAMFFERACKGDKPRGCGNLGDLYQSGRGVAKDEDTAQILFERACELGESFYCGRSETPAPQ